MNRQDLKKSKLLAALLMAGVSTAAIAQEDDDLDLELFDDDPVLEEIIVTARKRQETLQDTPVAISALSAEALQEAGISNIRDLQQQVPGLNFSEMGSKNPSIFIRGVGQREANTALDPGVGVYINNIYIARTDGQLLDTVDTQSIQVLRGPQGTLFGKNNTGGAMLVTTIAPHPDAFEGYVSTRLGNFGRKDAKLSANIPLNDENLAVRVSLNSTVLDGYLKSVTDGKKYGDEDRLAGSARFFWQAGDEFYVDVFTYWSKQNERGAAFNCFFQNPGANLAVFKWPGDADKRNFKDRCDRSAELADDNKVLINGPSVFEMTNQIAALTLSWEMEDVEIKSITAFSRQTDIVVQDDQDGTDIAGVNNGTISLESAIEGSLAGFEGLSPEQVAALVIPDERPSAGWVGPLPQDDTFADHGQYQDEEREQFSQELQIIGSALDERLSYTAGIFYAKEELENTVFTQLIGPSGYSSYTLLGLDNVVQKLIGSQSDLTNETYAFFAQSTYDVTDWFQLTGGIRYTVENRERTATIYAGNCTAVHTLGLIAGGSANLCGAGDTLLSLDSEQFLNDSPDFLPVQLVQYLNTVPEPTGELDANGNPITASELIFTDNGIIEDDKRFTKVTPTITTSFNIPEEYFEDSNMDSSLIYFTVSKGYKAGGFEMKGAQMVEFDPEEVTNFELGWKMDAFENRVRFNMAAYRMDYEDMQIRIAEQGKNLADIFLFISNAGDATIQGIEMELMALPMNNLTIQWSMNYTDAKYDEFTASKVDSFNPAAPITIQVDRSDEPFGSIPALTYSLTAMYDFNTSVGTFSPRLTMYYRDEVYTGIDDVADGTDDDPRTEDINEAFETRNYEDIATIDDYLLFNFRLAFVPPEETFNVTLFVNNVTDKDYFQGGFTQSGALGGATVTKGSPRAYGLEAVYNF